jgi:hypothetical protein
MPAKARSEVYVDRESLRLHRYHEIYRIERRRRVEGDVPTLTVSRPAQPSQPSQRMETPTVNPSLRLGPRERFAFACRYAGFAVRCSVSGVCRLYLRPLRPAL